MASSSFLNPYPGSKNPGNLTTKGGLGSALGTDFSQNQQEMGQTQGQRNTEAGTTLGGYQGLVDSGGYSPTEKSNIEQSTLGGINASYNSAADAAQRRLGVTHNAAGYGSFMEKTAQNKGRDLSQAGLQVQSQFANEAYQRKIAGLQGLAQMYGVDTSFLSSLGQQNNQILSTGQSVQSGRKGVLGDIGAGIGLTSQVLHL